MREGRERDGGLEEVRFEAFREAKSDNKTGPGERTNQRALESAFLCLKKGAPVFTDFLDTKSASDIMRLTKETRGVKLIKNGGHTLCERVMICFCPEGFPENEIHFPLKALYIDSSKFVKNLTHRDFLGSLIGLGLDRGKIGDIFVNEGNAVVFVREEIAGFLLMEFVSVGRAKVKVTEFTGEQFPFEKDGKIIKVSVPSMRLDAVIGEAFGLSRGKSADLIRAEKVFINHTLAASVSKGLAEGDVVSARGLGRAVVREIVGESKKGRLFVEIERF